MSSEKALFDQEIKQLVEFQKVSPTRCRGARARPRSHQQPRFARVHRPFPPSEVVNKRGTIQVQYPSDIMAKKLWKILEAKARGEGGGCSITYGA
jgi:isocitrate lyase